MRIGIDLLWVRPGICGGTESYIRNLLHGFGQYDRENEYVLFAARDNIATFVQYEEYPNMTLRECSVCCESQAGRILWENLHLDRKAKKEKLDLMFIPVYSKPLTYGSKIPYVCVIHDLQALHLPRYFSKVRRMYLRFLWWIACRTSAQVIASSEFCREDLIRRYPYVKEKIRTIYDPIISRPSGMDAAKIEEKYGIERGRYFYCVSSLLPHKNLETILKVMAEFKRQGRREYLVISGVGGREEEFNRLVKELDIEEWVVQTGFVSNEERDCLYENCEMFLFPSIFEGFGMPPIEAMRKGKNVVMTRESCLGEVTEGKAVYVTKPMDVEEWIGKIEEARRRPAEAQEFAAYELENVATRYIGMFREVADGVTEKNRTMHSGM